MKQLVYSLEQLDQAVELIYQHMKECKIITFTGVLGAGKTTLIRALLRRCGIQEVIASPTFTYVNIYENEAGQTFYHFDCYRIRSLNDFKAAGFDEYLYLPNSWAFIEWPEVINPLLTHNVCQINLNYQGDQRILQISIS
jgi:tRNA threonylcarbamoyladenosine biosynthesis protein TsaE